MGRFISFDFDSTGPVKGNLTVSGPFPSILPNLPPLYRYECFILSSTLPKNQHPPPMQHVGRLINCQSDLSVWEFGPSSPPVLEHRRDLAAAELAQLRDLC